MRDLLDLRSLRRDRLDGLDFEEEDNEVEMAAASGTEPSRDLGLDSMNCKRLSKSSAPRYPSISSAFIDSSGFTACKVIRNIR